MPIIYGVPPPPLRHPRTAPATDLNGEDIALRGADFIETAAGDWGTVADVAAAKQSVEREAGASPGEMPRRPEWGMGIRDELMRGAGKDSRDRQVAAARRRLNANPRITSVRAVDASPRPDISGATTVTIIAESNGKPLSIATTVKPRGA